MLRSIRAACALLLLAVALPSCANTRETLTVYSGRAENLIRPLLERFAKQEQVSVDVRYGSSADLALLIGEEGDRSPADVLISQSPGAVGYLAGRKRLAKLSQETLELSSDRFRPASGLWVGTSGRQRVLVYDSRAVQPSDLPASVFDLTDELYRNQVAVAPQNASFQDFVSAMRATSGEARTEQWLIGLKRNGAKTYPNNNAIVDAVARGEVRMGLVNHYYNLQFLKENPSLATRNHQFPASDPGSLVLISTASVTASSKRQEQAEKLIRFLLDEGSQRYFASETLEYPVVTGVAPPKGLSPLSDVKSIAYDFDALGTELRATTDLIGRSGLAD